jgi:hypothetical protein
MRDEVAKAEDVSREEVVIYQDNASAYGDRAGMNTMVEEIISGKISRIYILWEDRLSRSPCLTRLLESICEKRGVEIICIEPECTDEDELQIAFQEALHLINIVVNKKNGRRGGAVTKKSMSDETLKLCYEMYRDGCSVRQIESELASRGIKDEKTGQPFKRGVIQTRLNDNYQALMKLYGDEPSNSFVEWCQRYVKKSRGKTKVGRAKIASAYLEWVEQNNKMPVSQSCITKTIEKLYSVERTYKAGTRCVIYKGISLNINK